MRLSELEGSCEGKGGRARLRYAVDPQLAGALVMPWVEVGPKTDFTHQFALKGLQPGAAYYYSLETSQASGSDTRHSSTRRGLLLQPGNLSGIGQRHPARRKRTVPHGA